jgi:hypothetical protein
MTSDPVVHGGINYVDDPAVSAYFSAREHEAYYLSLKRVDEKRAFHDALKGALARVLDLADDRARRIIDEIIARSIEG